MRIQLFRNLIEKLTNIKEDRFILYYSGNDDTLREIIDNEKQVSVFRPVKSFTVRHGKRLGPGDERIAITYLNWKNESVVSTYLSKTKKWTKSGIYLHKNTL